MRRALVVVTSHYAHSTITHYESPGRVGKTAERVLGSPDLGGFDVESIVDSDSSTFRNVVYDFFNSGSGDDVLFAFFSLNAWLSASGELYLLAADSDPHRLPPTAIPAAYLAERIDECQSRQIVVVLDCDYATKFAIDLSRKGDRVLIVTLDAYAFTEKRALFSELFFKGIESGAADRNRDGLISVREAFDYAADYAHKSHVGRPSMRTGTTRDLVLCRSPAKPAEFSSTSKRVFMSYVREDNEPVDRLAHALRQSGFTVWQDRTDLLPGMNWQSEIKNAIQAGDYFIACFSPRYTAKQVSYMNEELILAIEQLRRMPRSRRWFIPIMLEKCEIPQLPIGLGETLDNLHYADFSQDWDVAFQSVVRSLILE